MTSGVCKLPALLAGGACLLALAPTPPAQAGRVFQGRVFHGRVFHGRAVRVVEVRPFAGDTPGPAAGRVMSVENFIGCWGVVCCCLGGALGWLLRGLAERAKNEAAGAELRKLMGGPSNGTEVLAAAVPGSAAVRRGADAGPG